MPGGLAEVQPPTDLQACVMEAVSYVAGEPWSDHPRCASPIITSFLIGWNDALHDSDRQILKPYIPRIVGTRTTKADEETRAWMLTDWLARECAPAWLRLAGLTAQAEMLEGLAPLTSAATGGAEAASEGRPPVADGAPAALLVVAGDLLERPGQGLDLKVDGTRRRPLLRITYIDGAVFSLLKVVIVIPCLRAGMLH